MHAIKNDVSRRNFLKSGGKFLGGLMLAPKHIWIKDLIPDGSCRYKIAVADIMILKRQKIGAFDLTKEIGADGVEIDMGGLGNRESFENKLNNSVVRQEFLSKSKETNVGISSLAMTGFYSQSFATRATWQKNISDCITTMKAMKIKAAFLPLGVNSDLKKYPELRPSLVQRLRVAGELAHDMKMVIGIETSLDAADEVKFLRDINSPGIKSYFNFANALDAGRNVSEELKILGKENLCQIHCTDTDGVWLQNDAKINMKEIKNTLDKMHWSGWLVIQRSRDMNDVHNVKYNFSANTKYMKSIFQ